MIQKVLGDGRVPVKVWTANMESEAEEQLKLLAELPFLFKHVAVMPDVHAGKGSTVGTVFATKDVIIPSAVGVDIGCGMSAVKTPYHIDQIKDKLELLRKHIEFNIPVGFAQHKTGTLVEFPEYDPLFNEFEDAVPGDLHGLMGKAMAQCGTLGGGNHFIEISTESDGTVWILLHSGSRNIGKMIAEFYINKAQQLMSAYHIGLPHCDLAYLPISTDEGEEYYFAMDWAQRYAQTNRGLMMRLVKRELAAIAEGNDHRYFDPLMEIDCHHNYTTVETHFGEEVFVTRKGAIRAQNGDYGIIPGSMGTRSYIVLGLGNKDSFNSASHGAGRKMSRGTARRTFTVDDARKQTEGVVCRKDDGVLDELPGAYKDIDEVMENEQDLVTPIHTLKQVISIKG